MHTLTPKRDPLRRAQAYLGSFLPTLLESGTAYGALIIAEGDDVSQYDMGDAPACNELVVLTLETARSLQSLQQPGPRSVVTIDQRSMIETAAILVGGPRREVWAWGGGTGAEALGILCFLLFISKRVDARTVFSIAGGCPQAPQVIETFNVLRGPGHAPLPQFVKASAANAH